MPATVPIPYSLLPCYDAVNLGSMIGKGLRVLPAFDLFNPGMCLIGDELHIVMRNGVNLNNSAHRGIPYQSALQKAVLDARTFKLKRLPAQNYVTVDGHPAVVHDVRISQSRIMTGAKRLWGGGTSVFFEPVMGYYEEGKDLEFHPIYHKFPGKNHKNWTHIVDDWFDFGSMECGKSGHDKHVIGRVKNTLGDEHVSEPDLKTEILWYWRGAAPPVMLNPGLFLCSGHQKEGDIYQHAFWLMPHPETMKPDRFIGFGQTDIFRIGYSSAYNIQFLMGVVNDPFDNDMMIISFGYDDSQACVARIRKADIYGLMV